MKEWIPIAERLPEEYVSVLVCIPADYPLPMVKEAYLADGTFHTKMWFYRIHEISHWMPMPEPPQEVQP